MSSSLSIPPDAATEATTVRERWGTRIAAGVIAVGFALRAWLAIHDDGIYWPDEIFQSLEPAHRLVFGYGLVAWEFIDGARNWALPGFVAGLLKLAALFGAGPRGYVTWTKLVFCAVGAATAFGAFRLARALGASVLSSAAGTAVVSLGAPFIYFAPRAMSETACALPAIFGLALALPKNARPWSTVVGASLLGISVLFRLQAGVFCIGLCAILAARREGRALGRALGTLGIWAALYGLLDRLTWGGWFHSAIKYLEFNLVEGRSAQWGTAVFSYYARVLWTSLGMTWVLVGVLALFALRRAPGLVLTALAFFALHSMIPHKELRFMLPVLPLFAALGAVGVDSLPGEQARLGATAALLLASLGSAIGFHRLTFGDLGQYEDSRPRASAYDDFGPVNRLLFAAHEQKDLCGLKIESAHLAWTGGSTYLHQPLPIFPGFDPGRTTHFYNYVITLSQFARDATIVASEGNQVLIRMPWTQCTEAVGYSWRLP